MSSPCSQRPQRRRQHASLSGRTDSSAESDEETKAANKRRRRPPEMDGIFSELYNIIIVLHVFLNIKIEGFLMSLEQTRVPNPSDVKESARLRTANSDL